MPGDNALSVAKKSKNNPHKVNQYTDPDPRQAMFLALYLDPKSDTFSNGLQSALAAGYSQEYAENLLAKMPAWLSDKVGEINRDRLLAKAERNLDAFLDIPTRVHAMGAFGKIYEKKESFTTKTLKNGKTKKVKKIEKVPVFVENGKLLEIKQKTTHFVAERVGKTHYGGKGDTKVAIAVQLNAAIGADRDEFA